MMQKISIILSSTAIALSLWILFVKDSGSSLRYVNTNTVYNEFDYKKEMEKELDNIVLKRKNILDSLMLQLQDVSKKIELSKGKDNQTLQYYQMLKQDYLFKEQKFAEENQALVRKYTDQIWAQLNQYIKEYRGQSGYELIFGADGAGALMAADEKLEITTDVVKFVNGRYAGISSEKGGNND